MKTIKTGSVVVGKSGRVVHSAVLNEQGDPELPRCGVIKFRVIKTGPTPVFVVQEPVNCVKCLALVKPSAPANREIARFDDGQTEWILSDDDTE